LSPARRGAAGGAGPGPRALPAVVPRGRGRRDRPLRRKDRLPALSRSAVCRRCPAESQRSVVSVFRERSFVVVVVAFLQFSEMLLALELGCAQCFGFELRILMFF